MRLHRTGPLLRAYRWLPHRVLDGAAGFAMRRRRPRSLVRAATRLWIRRGDVDMGDFEPGPFDTLEAFFLRRLRPGARPLGAGWVAPADGIVMSAGTLPDDGGLRVKGQRIPVERLVGAEASGLAGGVHTTIFLTPDGYHRVHAPASGRVAELRSIGGRTFPQNEDALAHVPRIYERNVRKVLRLDPDEGPPILVVLVGASLVGGIHVAAPPGTRLERGAELGHFTVGSTVVLLAPPETAARLHARAGERIRVGETLWSPQGAASPVTRRSFRACQARR